MPGGGQAGGEFSLIARYFTWPTPSADLGVGDDAALLRVAPGMQLAVSTDLLVEGTHFLAGTDPGRLGHKALAVNLSDMAAMGARPRWATLALSLPSADDRWLDAFSGGLRALAGRHGTELVGGDTTRGPLSLCVTILGEVPAGQALRRDGACAGDEVWVSGTLGDAAIGLALLTGARAPALDAAAAAACIERLEAPQPRVALGLALRGIASAALDVSDGFAADLGHILERSGVGACVEVARLPASAALAPFADDPAVREALLGGGDDYELCFTAPAAAAADVVRAAAQAGVLVTRVGRIVPGAGLALVDEDGRELPPARRGFDHFG
ncbi:MAG: thiamine-phosphate kinase [bacterium]|jgi:thiamine-monophosphate kinase|nr:thiamine-phosphate kinase [Betaproteobacteria bacterium]